MTIQSKAAEVIAELWDAGVIGIEFSDQENLGPVMSGLRVRYPSLECSENTVMYTVQQARHLIPAQKTVFRNRLGL